MWIKLITERRSTSAVIQIWLCIALIVWELQATADDSPQLSPVSPSIIPSASDLKNEQWISEGRLKFIQTCAYCHGQEGDSGKVRPFREREKWDPQFIHDTIANGRQRGANVMPSWKSSIPDETIWKIVAYIKSLEGKPKKTASGE